MRRALPWAAVAFAAAWTAWQARPTGPAPGGFDLEAAGRIPVVFNGRVKPLDSFARAELRVISERETWDDADGRTQPAMRWLLDVMTESLDPEGRSRRHRIFRIVEPRVRERLGLPERARYRYALEELERGMGSLGKDMDEAEARRAREAPLDAYDRELLKLGRSLRFHARIRSFADPHLVAPSVSVPEWRTLTDALRGKGTVEKAGEAASAWVGLLDAWSKREAGGFNAAAASLISISEARIPAERRRAAAEAAFNRADPFNACKAVYLAAFVLTAAGWLFRPGAPGRAAFFLVAFGVALHTAALLARIWLSGRPPVTNLYSSAVFVGWGAVLFGLAFERLSKLGIGTIIAAASGFATLQIAHVLAADGDTMEVLQAVLDTQFWLSTHVTTITLGYSATFVAGLSGIIYVTKGFFTRTLTAEARSVLARMIYGSVCFATFFSFVGTVLGGLWADDSWGRFWGWDPKENGALMIVLWNALILHARWGGLVRERGLAVLAVAGNIVTAWSWFGVNELNVGLHSYGFTEGRGLVLLLFVLSQIAVMAFGVLPGSSWRSPDAVRNPARDAESSALHGQNS